MNNYSEFAAMRADLLRDYKPANAQERLLVLEVANSWRRMTNAREREGMFFDLQRHHHAVRDKQPPESYQKDGVEVVMWLDTPTRAFDQILRAIRDAEIAFDRAIRRVRTEIDKRVRSESLPSKTTAAKTGTDNRSTQTRAAGLTLVASTPEQTTSSGTSRRQSRTSTTHTPPRTATMHSPDLPAEQTDARRSSAANSSPLDLIPR